MTKRDRLDGRSPAGRAAYTWQQRRAIAHNIRNYRHQKGLSQAALQKAIGCQYSASIYNIEHELNYVMPNQVQAIAQALGITEADLLKE